MKNLFSNTLLQNKVALLTFRHYHVINVPVFGIVYKDINCLCKVHLRSCSYLNSKMLSWAFVNTALTHRIWSYANILKLKDTINLHLSNWLNRKYTNKISARRGIFPRNECQQAIFMKSHCQFELKRPFWPQNQMKYKINQAKYVACTVSTSFS